MLNELSKSGTTAEKTLRATTGKGFKELMTEGKSLGEVIQILQEEAEKIGKSLNDMIYISLIDHVHTSIVRFLEGITVKNVLLWDIRRFYREEYETGLLTRPST